MEEFFIPAFKAHNELERESKAVLKGKKVRIKALPALSAAPPVNTLEYWINVGMVVTTPGISRLWFPPQSRLEWSFSPLTQPWDGAQGHKGAQSTPRPGESQEQRKSQDSRSRENPRNSRSRAESQDSGSRLDLSLALSRF